MQEQQVVDEEQTKQKLEEYQRKFRNLESDRKAYAEETVAVIKKQRGIIDKLKNENHQLKDVISKMNAQKIQGAQTTYPQQQEGQGIEDLKQEISTEAKKQQEIQRHITDFQKKIIEKRGSMGGYNAGTENETVLEKQTKILENRLDKANQKFNEAIAINKQLRQQIDSLRRERVIFDKLYKKLEKELHEKRKEMANIIETANTAYEERDKANDHIQNLKQQAKRESADFEKDLRDLSQMMEKNKKALEFMKNADKNREEGKIGNELGDSDKFNKTKTQKLYKERNLNQGHFEKIQKYEEDFAKIQAATKITEFDRLVEEFNKNEENNFKTFKFVNELSNEIEDLEKMIQELLEELKQYQGPGNAVESTNRIKMKQLEEKLSRSENKSEQFEFRFHDANKLINSLTNWIETLFHTIDCDKNIAKELAGSQQVTEGNMMVFLGIIEERISFILQAYSQITLEKNKDTYNQLLSNISQLTATALKDKPNKEIGNLDQEEQDEEEGDSEKILTLEDFRKKAIEKLEAKRPLKGQIKKGSSKQKKK